MPQTDPSAPAPLQLGRFVVRQRLGLGGMAEVMDAEVVGPEGFRKRVALKFMLAQLANDPELRQLFFREARIAASLSHPHLVQVLDFGEVEGRYFISLEFLEGGNLRDLLRRRRKGVGEERLDGASIASIGMQLAGALVYLHGLTDDSGQPRPVIHRDVSPDNAFVTREGVVKLIDFGIATGMHHERDLTVRPGEVRGKPGYLAPEAITRGSMEPPVDVFALGVTLWELAAGHPMAFGTVEEALRRRIHEPSPPLRPEAPELDEELLALIAWAVEPDERRRVDATTLERSLARWLVQHAAVSAQQIAARLVVEGAASSKPRRPDSRGGGISETAPFGVSQPNAALSDPREHNPLVEDHFIQTGMVAAARSMRDDTDARVSALESLPELSRSAAAIVVDLPELSRSASVIVEPELPVLSQSASVMVEPALRADAPLELARPPRALSEAESQQVMSDLVRSVRAASAAMSGEAPPPAAAPEAGPEREPAAPSSPNPSAPPPPRTERPRARSQVTPTSSRMRLGPWAGLALGVTAAVGLVLFGLRRHLDRVRETQGAAVVGTPTQLGLMSFRIDSEPPGAVVKLDGSRNGLTPLSLTVLGGMCRHVEISLPGHETWSREVCPEKEPRLRVQLTATP